jgi:hypothetical protein
MLSFFTRISDDEPIADAWKAQRDVVTYNLPDSSLSGRQWGSISIRRLSKHLNPKAKNSNSLRISDDNSDLVLYRFKGDEFNDVFQALRVPKGQVYWWKYNANVGSFILQRDAFIDIQGNVAQLPLKLMQNHLIPTNMLADRITGVIHDSVKTQSGRFYSLSLKRGRIEWDTVQGFSKYIDHSRISTPVNQWPYRDYLKYSYKATGRLKADAHNYDISITLWIEPMLDNGELVFAERGWRVYVSTWIWHNVIRNAIADQVKKQYTGLGSVITKQFTTALRDLLGDTPADTILKNNKQLVFSHPCIYDIQRVGYPDHAYTSDQMNNICGWTTPFGLLAPGIRLLKVPTRS